MKLKKNLLVSIAAVALLSAGAGIVSQESTSQVVEAKTVSKKLTHNAAVYNSRGKRTHAKTLKKGKKVRVYGYKKIHGKSYARIGKNKYVKTANLKKHIKVIKKAKVTKKSVKRSTKNLAYYKKQLKKANALVANKNTSYKLSVPEDGLPSKFENVKVKKGKVIPLDDIDIGNESSMDGISIAKRKGHLVLEYFGEDSDNEYIFDLANFDLKHVKHISRYEED